MDTAENGKLSPRLVGKSLPWPGVGCGEGCGEDSGEGGAVWRAGDGLGAPPLLVAVGEAAPTAPKAKGLIMCWLRPETAISESWVRPPEERPKPECQGLSTGLGFHGELISPEALLRWAHHNG